MSSVRSKDVETSQLAPMIFSSTPEVRLSGVLGEKVSRRERVVLFSIGFRDAA